MPKENIYYSCIACVTIDSATNFNLKNHPQVYFKECKKYRIKKTQIPTFIKSELKSDSESDSDLDDKLMAKLKDSDSDFDLDLDLEVKSKSMLKKLHSE